MKNLQEKAIIVSEKFLERRGYEIIDTSWKAPDGFGTIDIVAEDEDAIVFVNVKAARGTDGFLDEGKSRDKRPAGGIGLDPVFSFIVCLVSSSFEAVRRCLAFHKHRNGDCVQT